MKTLERLRPVWTGALCRVLPPSPSAIVKRPAPTQPAGTLPDSKASLQGSGAKTRTRAVALRVPRVALTLPDWVPLAGTALNRPSGLMAPASPSRVKVAPFAAVRSEEHTSALQSRENLVCRLLLEKK